MCRRLTVWLRRLEDRLLITVLAALIILAIGQVILRNVWNAGLGWSGPLLRILVLWLALLGGIYSGYFAVSEAAAVTTVYVLIVEVLIYREISPRQ